MKQRQDWAAVNAKEREAEKKWFDSHHRGNHPPCVRVSTCKGCHPFLQQEVWPWKR